MSIMTSVSERCMSCKGPFHESTGHRWKGFPDAKSCGPCYRHFLKFYKGQCNSRWGGSDFYKEAMTSIRAGIWPLSFEEKK